jgi:hypothetical protein
MRNTVANAGNSAYLKASSGKGVTVQVAFASSEKGRSNESFLAAASVATDEMRITEKLEKTFK